MKNYVIGCRCFKNLSCAGLQLYFPVRIKTAVSFFLFRENEKFLKKFNRFRENKQTSKVIVWTFVATVLYVLVNAPVRVDSKSHFPLSPYRKMSRMLSSTLKSFEYFRENVKFVFSIFVFAPLNFCDYSDPFL